MNEDLENILIELKEITKYLKKIYYVKKNELSAKYISELDPR